MTWPLEIREKIIEELSRKSLNRLCQEPGWPSRGTVQRWMDEDADFGTRCARAREEHADSVVDSIEDLETDVLTGKLKAEPAKVVISSRQWRAEKLNSRKYGTKVDLNHTGGIKFEAIERTIVDPKE